MPRNQFVLAAVLGLMLAVQSTASAQVVINEAVPNPNGDQDELWEYVELYGRPGLNLNGYALAAVSGGIDTDGDGVYNSLEDVPEIDEAWSLDGLSLGSNGFLVLYNNTGSGHPSGLISNNLINASSSRAGFFETHIPSTDTPGKISNDGSMTFLLVRKRLDHSLDGTGHSVYGPEYAFSKDVRHDVNNDGKIDFGTELNAIGTSDMAKKVEPLQIVDEVSWANAHGKEYQRFADSKFSETPSFNPDALSRLRYYIAKPQRGYYTRGNTGAPFSIKPTSIADESFIYGELVDVFPNNPSFFSYLVATDPISGYLSVKAPTDMAATRYDGSCDPEPDDHINEGCAPNAGGAYEMADLAVSGFKLTPGTFNDHPSNMSIRQFRFVAGDFNCDGSINQIDRYLIESRVGATLDDTVPDVYDPTPGMPGDEVSFNRYVRQGAEFQLVAMMRDMNLTDGPGGTTNDPAVTLADVTAFLGLCTVCGNMTPPPAIRITEYMYGGHGGEFIEFTNLSGSAVNMSGWSFSDSARLAGQVDLGAFGIVMPGESVLLTEDDRARFAIDWNIVGKKVIGMLTQNLGRSDEINLYNASGILVDRLTYGDQDFSGTIRTQNFSGWPCDTAVGQNMIASWRLSLIGGDAQNSRFSLNGDVGSPGSFVTSNCATTIPTGACCTAGVCSSGPGMTQAYCQQTGGLYQGDGLMCNSVNCPAPSGATVRITEYMYSGPSGDIVEITNLGASPVNMAGWSFDDSGRVAGTFPIGSLGTLAVGESAIITESDATAFRTLWGLAPTVKVVGNLGMTLGNSLGRNDEINIFDASSALIDRLTYGDQDFPGTIRAQDAGGWPCTAAVGANMIARWTLAANGDSQNSYTAGGAIASPAHFVFVACPNPDPTGACCYPNGNCTESQTQAACTSGGGTWAGEGVTCPNAHCPQPVGPKMRITEWMYNPLNSAGEFVEFTNIGDTPADMTGWSFDDDSRMPGSFSLSGYGTVVPGESVILTETTEAMFRSQWSVPAAIKIIGGSTQNLGRNDEINLYDATGLLIDRLTFGDQNIPGSIRTQGVSGWTCHENLAANNALMWQLSVVGDAQGSYRSTGATGDVGSPGIYHIVHCPGVCQTCKGDSDGNGSINAQDVVAFVNCVLGNTPSGQCTCSDMNNDGTINGLDVRQFIATFISSQGVCH